MSKAVLKMALCEGRHEIPQAVNGAIFPQEIRPELLRDPKALEWKAGRRIFERFTELYPDASLYVTYREWDNWDQEFKTSYGLENGNFHLDLYVTGLSVALVAVLNAARVRGVSVTLYHYDRETGEYYAQEVAA